METTLKSQHHKRNVEEEKLRWAAAGLIGLGILLRVARWGAGGSLRADEIRLVKKLMESSFAALLRPLVLGTSERGLRVLPLLAGCAGLWLIWKVGRRLLGDWGGVMAAGILAVLEPAIHDSAVVGGYSMEILVTLGMVWMFMWYEDQRNWKRAAALCGFGVVGMLFSQTVIFVLLGMGIIVIFWNERVKLDWKLLGAGCVWILGAGWFWQGMVKEDGPRQFAPMVVWAGNGVLGLFGSPETMWLTMAGRWESAGPVIGFMAAVIGGVVLGKRMGWRRAWMLAAPAILYFGVAGVVGYSVRGANLLFLVPMVILLMAGVAGRGGERGLAWLGGVLAAMVMATAMARAGRNMIRPPGGEEMTGVVKELAREVKAGDEVYVYYGAKPAWEWYGIRYSWPGVRLVQGRNREKDFTAFAEDAAEMHGRVWVVFSHTPTGGPVDARLAEEIKGEAKERIEERGAGAYLYEIKDGGGWVN